MSTLAPAAILPALLLCLKLLVARVQSKALLVLLVDYRTSSTSTTSRVDGSIMRKRFEYDVTIEKYILLNLSS